VGGVLVDDYQLVESASHDVGVAHLAHRFGLLGDPIGDDALSQGDWRSRRLGEGPAGHPHVSWTGKGASAALTAWLSAW
jgi:hypothetical protein